MSQKGLGFSLEEVLLSIKVVLVFSSNLEMKCICMQWSEPLFVLDWVRTGQMIYMLHFYCAQVSIAGQPGGVEAARVKIRVSWNSAPFVLKGYSTKTLIPLKLVSL